MTTTTDPTSHERLVIALDKLTKPKNPYRAEAARLREEAHS